MNDYNKARPQCTLPHKNVQGFNGYQEVTNEDLITLYEPPNHNLYSMRAKLLQSYLTLGNSMDCSPLGSYVHGILQARILRWVAISSSRGSSQPKDQTHVPSVSCTGRRVLYH